jgi:broad specificity phosphatase PhoE
MQITLIRHLPTEWNKKTWLQGRKDIPISKLNDRDKKQIEHNQVILSQLAPFDIVLASSLIRTQQTANLYGYKPEIDGLLDELDFGPFEGVPRAKLLEICGEQWMNNPSQLVLGESVVNLGNRVHLFLEKYHRVGNILVFGHGCWIRALLSNYHYGHINHMNQLTLGNNECTTLKYSL